MSEDEICDRDTELLKGYVAEIAKHFDTVQVFVTRQSPKLEGTVNATWGDGNWCARYGQVRHWLVAQDAIAAQNAIRDI